MNIEHIELADEIAEDDCAVASHAVIVCALLPRLLPKLKI
jgi:hypothetical protein